MPSVPRVLRPVLPCAFALAACSDHRYGFFPETDGDAGSSSISSTEPTTTTLSPTTISPTTVQPTTSPPPTTTPPTTITTDTDTATVTTDPTSATTSGVECGQIVLAPEVPQQFFGSLGGQGDSFSLICGGVGGSDLALVWRAPFTGRFQVDTIGSSFDTLVGVIDGTCFGKELACDDDAGGNLNSRVEVDLFAGQAVTIVVDSFNQSFGEFVVNITEVPIDTQCPDTAFEPIVPLVMPGQTAGAPNVRAGSCGGADGPEIEAEWFPPFDGLFHFEVIEADFDPVMYLLLNSCDGPELKCSDDAFGLFPGFDIELAGGEPVVIVVDGAASSGKFTLSISEG